MSSMVTDVVAALLAAGDFSYTLIIFSKAGWAGLRVGPVTGQNSTEGNTLVDMEIHFYLQGIT